MLHGYHKKGCKYFYVIICISLSHFIYDAATNVPPLKMHTSKFFNSAFLIFSLKTTPLSEKIEIEAPKKKSG